MSTQGELAEQQARYNDLSAKIYVDKSVLMSPRIIYSFQCEAVVSFVGHFRRGTVKLGGGGFPV